MMKLNKKVYFLVFFTILVGAIFINLTKVWSEPKISIQGSTNSDRYTYSEPIKVTALLVVGGFPVFDANVYAIVTRPDHSKIKILLHDDGMMGDDMPDGLYTGFFKEYVGEGEYQITIYANNDQLKAFYAGALFADIEPDSDGIVHPPKETPIKENFSKSLLLPTVTVRKTSK